MVNQIVTLLVLGFIFGSFFYIGYITGYRKAKKENRKA